MSRFWGYSKRPKNWKALLKDANNEDKPLLDKPVPDKPVVNKPVVNKPAPVGSPRTSRSQPDSSTSHL